MARLGKRKRELARQMQTPRTPGEALIRMAEQRDLIFAPGTPVEKIEQGIDILQGKGYSPEEVIEFLLERSPASLRPRIMQAVTNRATRRRVSPRQGEILVTTPDNPEFAKLPPDMQRMLRESDQPAVFVEDPITGEQKLAFGNNAIDSVLLRRQIALKYREHPLMMRYLHHIAEMKEREGVFRNTEPWHALAEKYAVTLGVSNLGSPISDTAMPGSFYFDPQFLAAQQDPEHTDAMGLYILRSIDQAVPYLWTNHVSDLSDAGELPRHNITRGLTPHPCMFWSFEAALGPPEARIDWMLVMETSRGYEIWCPIANDITQSGVNMLTGVLVPYGVRWPDYWMTNRQGQASLAEFFLKRISFLNSKYVQTTPMRPHRTIRREVERTAKKHHEPMPEDLTVQVIELRAVEVRVSPQQGDEHMRDFERKHCWWRRAHRRVLHRNTSNERVTWVKAALCGPPELPLIRTAVIVDR